MAPTNNNASPARADPGIRISFDNPPTFYFIIHTYFIDNINFVNLFIKGKKYPLCYQMKIAVVGIGVAGAYLMNKLSDDHDNRIVGFERMPEAQHDAVCAWATCENVMSALVKH